uniref:Mitogen-activated protein kinase kinase kinase n=1 Tax=Steinernema glaseri TaxID=37863 RepID=A0A1I8AG20_9BILA
MLGPILMKPPFSLLLDNFYQTLKICDFGTTVPQKTSMTNNRGTTCWMAPEVFQGRNLLLDNFYQTLKICDFGTTVPQKTSMTNNRGTTCWMAPEVFQGRKYDAKADVFSFGITLWEMVTRKFPFEELGLENPFAIQWQKYN